MDRIVYLLGAGASVNCIPVVEKLAEGFHEIGNLIVSPNEKLNVSSDQIENVNLLSEQIRELSKISKNRASIDTVAKSYFLQKNDALLRQLKISLSAYILLQQKYNPVDWRYDLFLASIFKESLTQIPENIKILSWNYDNQFELAYNSFQREHKFLGNRHELKIFDKNSKIAHLVDSGFIYKLNGSAGVTFDKRNDSESYSLDVQMNSVLKEFMRLNEEPLLEPGISFAWEHPHLAEERLPMILANCKIIVTIGYSFPFFNRQIDKMIFEHATKLEKVYIQNPKASEIEEKLQNLIDPQRKIKFVQDLSTNEFMIPYEL